MCSVDVCPNAFRKIGECKSIPKKLKVNTNLMRSMEVIKLFLTLFIYTHNFRTTIVNMFIANVK